ncbi:MAG: hypothetical protein AUJ75_03580 [Candidatus Omnitrophica bacterium CG1_02_49_10]|nr:MAG: hypothetical protein AUJ75_03580 [Candidatus Omnitrophica bacterium CG1_02_49_10]
MSDFGSDLFPEVKPGRKKRVVESDSFPFNRRIVFALTYEKAALIAMGAIMLLVIVYVLGINSSRHMTAGPKELTRMEAAAVEDTSKIESVPQREPDKAPEPSVTEALGRVTTAYAVQLASHTSNITADKETEALKAGGYNAFSIKSGKYFVVLVGGYPDKRSAEKGAESFRARFKDCFVKSYNKGEGE